MSWKWKEEKVRVREGNKEKRERKREKKGEIERKRVVKKENDGKIGMIEIVEWIGGEKDLWKEE